MRHSRNLVIAAAVVALTAATDAAHGQNASDREGVRRAVLDYVEGFYEGDSIKLARSIQPELQKFGYFIPRDSTKYAGEGMSWPGVFSYAAQVRKRARPVPVTAPKEVTIFEVQDQTASAKLTAWWGTDYMLLAKTDGRWMIRMVLWQSLPPKAAG